MEIIILQSQICMALNKALTFRLNYLVALLKVQIMDQPIPSSHYTAVHREAIKVRIRVIEIRILASWICRVK